MAIERAASLCHQYSRKSDLEQRSPTFLAPGTGFVEDNFSTDGGREDGSGGNASDGEERLKLGSSPAVHLLLCDLVPNRPRTGTCPRPGGWGPLTWSILLWPCGSVVAARQQNRGVGTLYRLVTEYLITKWPCYTFRCLPVPKLPLPF